MFRNIGELLVFNLYFSLVYNASHHLYPLSWAMKVPLQFKPFKERQNTSFYLKMTICDIRTDVFLKISEILTFNLYFSLVYNASHHLSGPEQGGGKGGTCPGRQDLGGGKICNKKINLKNVVIFFNYTEIAVVF